MNEFIPWYKDWPDPVTEAIVRIDEELYKTQIHQDFIRQNCLCMTCGESGIHTHWRTND